ncbi:MAG: BrnT family toxin [Rubrivivax sp.]|nr:BrnT family toxin [Rubrivivax sp.]
MRIVFDPAKDKLNLADHGVSLALARELAWDEALVWLDDRFEYDELRMIGLVPRGDRLYYVAFVDRGSTRRVISLRYAERREVKHYVENYS